MKIKDIGMVLGKIIWKEGFELLGKHADDAIFRAKFAPQYNGLIIF